MGYTQFLTESCCVEGFICRMTSRKNVVFFWLHKNTFFRISVPRTLSTSAHSSMLAAGSLSTRSYGIFNLSKVSYIRRSSGHLSFVGAPVISSLIYIISPPRLFKNPSPASQTSFLLQVHSFQFTIKVLIFTEKRGIHYEIYSGIPVSEKT